MWRINGVTVVGGRPIGLAHIRVERGLNLVYGSNGVGKSKLLNSLAGLFAAEVPVRSMFGQSRSSELWPIELGRTATDLCTYAFYGEGGLHIDAPFEFLDSGDEFYRVLASSVGLDRDVENRIDYRCQEIDDRRTEWFERNSSPSGIVLARSDEPNWNDLIESASDDEWRRLDRSELRQELALRLFDGASSQSLSVADFLELVDSGQWMISRSGELFISASLSLESRFGWFESADKWSEIIAMAAGRRPLARRSGVEIDPDLEVANGLSLGDVARLGEGITGSLPPHPEHFGLVSPGWLTMPVAVIRGREEKEVDEPSLRRGTETTISRLVTVVFGPQELDNEGPHSDLESESANWLASRSKFNRHIEAHQLETQSGEYVEYAPRVFVSEDGNASSFLTTAIDELSERASSIFHVFFDDAPQLMIQLSSVDDWFSSGPKFQWMARFGEHRPFPITELGSAHRRFARYSIASALQMSPDGLGGAQSRRRASIAFVDEPERALHRIGEARIVRALPELADYVIAATHSPKFISESSVNLIHLTRGSDGMAHSVSHIGGYTDGVDGGRHELADHLGVETADLLSLTKVILLVEGPHDEMVLKFMCPEIVGHIDVVIIPLGGTEQIPALSNSRFLLDMTEARIVVATDNARIDKIRLLEAKAADRKNRGNHWLREFRDERKSATPEERQLIDLLIAAYGSNQESRFITFGFSRPDIVRFLPVHFISPSHETWDGLKRAFLMSEKRKKMERGDGERLKEWVRRQGGNYSLEGIRHAIDALSDEWERSGGVRNNRNPEFTDLVELIQRLR